MEPAELRNAIREIERKLGQRLTGAQRDVAQYELRFRISGPYHDWLGHRLYASPAIPDGEIWIVDGGKIVGKITGVQ